MRPHDLNRPSSCTVCINSALRTEFDAHRALSRVFFISYEEINYIHIYIYEMSSLISAEVDTCFGHTNRLPFDMKVFLSMHDWQEKRY